MGKPRVLAVFGSESGTAKRGISNLIKKWQADGTSFEVDVMSGNDAANKFGPGLESLVEMYDVFLVATCSYGMGEPPVNLKMLFDLLTSHSETGAVPLKGLQHAVLGYGSTMYETFQNCPRTTDKLLEMCGSRRLAQRAELDDSLELTQSEQPMYLQWCADVHAALCKLPSVEAPPASGWDQPCGKITDTMSVATSCPPITIEYHLVIFSALMMVLTGIAHFLGALPSPLVALLPTSTTMAAMLPSPLVALL